MSLSENSDLGRFWPRQHSWFCIIPHLGYIHHLIQSQYETVLIGIVGFCMHWVWSWSLKVQNIDKSALVTFFWAERFFQSMWPLGILCSSSTYILPLHLFLISGKKSWLYLYYSIGPGFTGCKSLWFSYADYYYNVNFCILTVLESTYHSTALPGSLSLSTCKCSIPSKGIEATQKVFWCTCCQMERGQLLKNILTSCSLTPQPRPKYGLTNSLGNKINRFPFCVTFLHQQNTLN